MKIKAISLWQPWASLIAVGAKKYETRSWSTVYRGPLLICAAKGGLSNKELLLLLENPEFIKALAPIADSFLPDLDNKIWHPGAWASALFNYLPFGRAVAIVDLTKCTKTENCFPKQMQGALPFGDFSPGRYAWKLENVRAIKPLPVTGRQGLFWVEVPDSLMEGG